MPTNTPSLTKAKKSLNLISLSSASFSNMAHPQVVGVAEPLQHFNKHRRYSILFK